MSLGARWDRSGGSWRVRLRLRREDDGEIGGGRCDDIQWCKVEGLLFYYCVFANVLGNLLEYICVTTKNVVKFDGLHEESVPCRCLMEYLLACLHVHADSGAAWTFVGDERKKERKKSVIDC